MKSPIGYYPNSAKTKKKQSLRAKIPINILMSIASILATIDLLIDMSFTSFLVFVLSIFWVVFTLWHREVIHLLNKFLAWQKRHKINLLPLLCTAVVTLWWLDITTVPAHAQFFVQTEDWLRQAFPFEGGAAGASGVDIYTIVFNTLRAIFVLYLAISLVRVIAAARNDEDWQSLARTPLIILVTVTLGDILASVITGGATGGTGGTGG